MAEPSDSASSNDESAVPPNTKDVFIQAVKDHRRWHDHHNRVHDQIMEQAHRHVPEPRFGR